MAGADAVKPAHQLAVQKPPFGVAFFVGLLSVIQPLAGVGKLPIAWRNRAICRSVLLSNSSNCPYLMLSIHRSHAYLAVILEHTGYTFDLDPGHTALCVWSDRKGKYENHTGRKRTTENSADTAYGSIDKGLNSPV
jgi:hypothetical protein